MALTNNTNLLTINSLQLQLFLGWPNEERLRKQMVTLDLAIRYPQDPHACVSDDLNDTVCYRQVIDSLRDKLSDKKFHLIEYVAQEIRQIVKVFLPPDTLLNVSLTKQPQIEGLGSVTFHLKEFTP